MTRSQRFVGAVAVSSVVAALFGGTPARAATAGGGGGAMAELVSRAGGLEPQVLELAMAATQCAARRSLVSHPGLITIIDYSKPSTEPRLWVVDLTARRVLFRELVAHGRNSGDNLAEHFSNGLGSLQSSLGLFVTGDAYVGQHGVSLRLRGLDEGFNDRAEARAIVVHGASYVDPSLAGQLGRLGRSWGCPAVRPAVAAPLIRAIKDGTPVFAYYPDQDWLRGSKFLHACG
jgi:hypothetical protein